MRTSSSAKDLGYGSGFGFGSRVPAGAGNAVPRDRAELPAPGAYDTNGAFRSPFGGLHRSGSDDEFVARFSARSDFIGSRGADFDPRTAYTPKTREVRGVLRLHADPNWITSPTPLNKGGISEGADIVLGTRAACSNQMRVPRELPTRELSPRDSFQLSPLRVSTHVYPLSPPSPEPSSACERAGMPGPGSRKGRACPSYEVQRARFAPSCGSTWGGSFGSMLTRSQVCASYFLPLLHCFPSLTLPSILLLPASARRDDTLADRPAARRHFATGLLAPLASRLAIDAHAAL